MRTQRRILALVAGALVALAAGGVTAQDGAGENLAPTLAEVEAMATRFDGTRSFNVTLPSGIDLREPVSIETWLAPGWDGQVDADPCVVSVLDGNDVLLAVRLSGKRDYVGLQVADRYLGVPWVIDPAIYHHLALVAGTTSMELFLDGQPTGLIDIGLPPRQGGNVEIGGCGPGQLSFAGRLAGLRVWATPLSDENILDHLAVVGDIRGQGHPREPFLQLQVLDGGDPLTVDVAP